MPVDKQKVNYYSGWRIDQLVDTDVVNIASAGDHPLVAIDGPPAVPEFEVQFQPTGSSQWFQPGLCSTDNTLANSFIFYSYISGSSVMIHTDRAGTARYFVWADKIDY